jgi:hypothetical protein
MGIIAAVVVADHAAGDDPAVDFHGQEHRVVRPRGSPPLIAMTLPAGSIEKVSDPSRPGATSKFIWKSWCCRGSHAEDDQWERKDF